MWERRKGRKKKNFKIFSPKVRIGGGYTQDGGALVKVYLDDDLMTNHPDLLWLGLCDSPEGHQLLLSWEGCSVKDYCCPGFL